MYKLIHFSLSLNPAIHRMGNPPNILYFGCNKQEESQPWFVTNKKSLNPNLYFIASFPKFLFSCHQWTNNQSEIHFKYPFQNYSQKHHNYNFFSIPWWCTVKILLTLSLEIVTLVGFKSNPCQGMELPFSTITETLM